MWTTLLPPSVSVTLNNLYKWMNIMRMHYESCKNFNNPVSCILLSVTWMTHIWKWKIYFFHFRMCTGTVESPHDSAACRHTFGRNFSHCHAGMLAHSFLKHRISSFRSVGIHLCIDLLAWGLNSDWAIAIYLFFFFSVIQTPPDFVSICPL